MDDKLQKRRVLEELLRCIEDLLASGLSTASASTQRTLDLALAEVSRERILRLGASLRVVQEELRRFDQNSARFLPERLAFFLDRTWLLTRAMLAALDRQDIAGFEALSRANTPVALPNVEAVVVGVFKRHVPESFSLFELRLRVLAASGPLVRGAGVALSFVFPARPGVEIPAETFLGLEQPQKFKPSDLLDGRAIRFENLGVLRDDSPARLVLSKESRVTLGAAVDTPNSLVPWDRARAATRVQNFVPDPISLPIELQEEASFRSWSLGAFRDVGRPFQVATLQAEELELELRADSEHTRTVLTQASAQRPQPSLFGLLHYELCRFVFTPLSLLGDLAPPVHCMLEAKTFDPVALVKALSIR